MVNLTKLGGLLLKIEHNLSVALLHNDNDMREIVSNTIPLAAQATAMLGIAERVEYVVQKLDKTNEARGAAIQAVGEFKRSRMTPEERRAKVERDTDDLFGSAKERSGL